MKYIYKFIILFLLFIFLLYSQSYFNKIHKKLQKFSNENIPFEFIFPFDFQYKIWKEGNFYSLEGKNIGIPRFHLRTATLYNLKKIEYDAFKKKFFHCNFKNQKEKFFLDLIKQNIKNEYLKEYQLCFQDPFLEYRSFLLLEDYIYIVILNFFIEDVNSPQNEIIDIINQIHFKNIKRN